MNDKADLPKVIDKIRKLLALGTSPNEHEAALAVAKAQEMLQAYDLTMESIADLKADPRTSVRHGSAIVRTTDGKPEGWKADIFEAVAESSDCFTAYTHETETTKSGRYRTVKAGRLIGFGHDVEMAGYALSFLVAEIERLAQAYADTMWAEIRDMERGLGITHQEAESRYVAESGRHPLKAKLYFTRGAAEAVCEKLRRASWDRRQNARRHAEAGDNPYAIVLDKRRTVEDFIYMERYGKTKAEVDAEWEARSAKWRSEREAVVKSDPEETEAQRRKREERERRASDRYWESQRRKQEREEAKVDRLAKAAGEHAGRSIEIRPGINPGAEMRKLG